MLGVLHCPHHSLPLVLCKSKLLLSCHCGKSILLMDKSLLLRGKGLLVCQVFILPCQSLLLCFC